MASFKLLVAFALISVACAAVAPGLVPPKCNKKVMRPECPKCHSLGAVIGSDGCPSFKCRPVVGKRMIRPLPCPPCRIKIMDKDSCVGAYKCVPHPCPKPKIPECKCGHLVPMRDPCGCQHYRCLPMLKMIKPAKCSECEDRRLVKGECHMEEVCQPRPCPLALIRCPGKVIFNTDKCGCKMPSCEPTKGTGLIVPEGLKAKKLRAKKPAAKKAKKPAAKMAKKPAAKGLFD